MLITIKALSFAYGRRQVLQNINAALPRGEVVALVGANGSGKTTLMQLLLANLRPSSGEIIYDTALMEKNTIAFVADKPPLYPDWQVQEFLLRLAQERGVNKATVRAVMARCGLQAVAAQRCRELSHGYRQRVNLAQALLHQPLWLCMDEPMNGLDDEQRHTLRAMVAALVRDGMTVLLTLHDLTDVVAMADRVWYLRDSKLFDLPIESEQDKWVVFTDEAAAQQYALGVQQGRTRGFSQDEFMQIAPTLLADSALENIGCSYPVAALQARMAACV